MEQKSVITTTGQYPLKPKPSSFENILRTFAFMVDVSSMGNEKASKELLRILKSERDPLNIFISRDGPMLVALIDYFSLTNPNQSIYLEEIEPEVAIEILTEFHRFKTKVTKLSQTIKGVESEKQDRYKNSRPRYRN